MNSTTSDEPTPMSVCENNEISSKPSGVTSQPPNNDTFVFQGSASQPPNTSLFSNNYKPSSNTSLLSNSRSKNISKFAKNISQASNNSSSFSNSSNSSSNNSSLFSNNISLFSNNTSLFSNNSSLNNSSYNSSLNNSSYSSLNNSSSNSSLNNSSSNSSLNNSSSNSSSNTRTNLIDRKLEKNLSARPKSRISKTYKNQYRNMKNKLTILRNTFPELKQLVVVRAVKTEVDIMDAINALETALITTERYYNALNQAQLYYEELKAIANSINEEVTEAGSFLQSSYTDPFTYKEAVYNELRRKRNRVVRMNEINEEEVEVFDTTDLNDN